MEGVCETSDGVPPAVGGEDERDFSTVDHAAASAQNTPWREVLTRYDLATVTGLLASIAFGASWALSAAATSSVHLSPEQTGVDFTSLTTRALVLLTIGVLFVGGPACLLVVGIIRLIEKEWFVGSAFVVGGLSYVPVALWIYGEWDPSTSVFALVLTVTGLTTVWCLVMVCRKKVGAAPRWVAVVPAIAVMLVMFFPAAYLPQRIDSAVRLGDKVILPLGVIRVEPVDLVPHTGGPARCYVYFGTHDGLLAVVLPGAKPQTVLLPASDYDVHIRGRRCGTP